MAPPEQNRTSAVQTTVSVQHFNQQMAKAHRWYEVVRCLRAFYDHFRIAFPHLAELPKSYTDDWAEQFKETAREFVQNEDMHSVQKVLHSAGYGTDKWLHISAKEAAEIEQAFARLVEAVEHIEDEYEETETTESKIIPLSPHTESDDNSLEALQKRYDESRTENRTLQTEIDTQQQRIAELEGQIRRQDTQPEVAESVAQRHAPTSASNDIRELDTLQKRFERAKKENHELEEEIDKQNKQIINLEGQIRRFKNSDVKIIHESSAHLVPVAEPDPSEQEKLQHRFESLQKDHQELQASFSKKEDEVRALNEEMKKLLANFEQTPEPTTENTSKKFETPSSMGAQVREYEQKLKANELLIKGLRSENERAQQAVDEYKDELQRQRERRRIFEEEMEEERQSLREQMHKLKMLLAAENRDNLSLEDLEKMEGDELISYLEEVETEKQRAIAGLEALEAQEESYQKQLDAQQEELGTIQNDLERFKESNLATEMESAEETITAQREQLETLLSFSKNLKAQVAHLKERQDPMRSLIERLNLQEKALIRYIRVNHDRAFMPAQAYDTPEE